MKFKNKTTGQEVEWDAILINSNLVSAQNRQRLYWTNIENVEQPEDRNIVLKDILELDAPEEVTTEYITKRKTRTRWGNHYGTMETKKHNTLCAIGKCDVILLEDLKRYMLPIECERLQTVPDNYTAVAAMTHRYHMLGNGWTVDVIEHILRNI